MTSKKTLRIGLWRILMLALIVAVSTGMLFNVDLALAEGSWQAGLNQPLTPTPSVETQTFYVDILASGEVINVSLSTGSFSIYDPTGAVRVNDQAGGQVLSNDPFNAPITTAYKYTTDMAGTWRVVLAEDTYDRFDITVTPDTATNPDPRDAGGRVHSYHLAFNTGSYAKELSTDADYFILVPGGRPDTNYVWRLDLNQFAGYVYELIANDLGVDPPYSGYSIPMSAGSWTPKFPMYFGYPAIADPPPLIPPLISNLRFIDSEGVDMTISPGGTIGVQDSGFFSFTTDITGTYAIVIDTNRDGEYAAGDVLLLGNAYPGENGVEWDGKGPGGTTLPLGIYTARLHVRMGEYHFLSFDAETSGGDEDGLTVCQAFSATDVATDTLVFWDDITYLDDSQGPGTTTLPHGELCSTSAGRHTWGNFTGSGFGNERFIDTYVYGLSAYAEVEAILADNDDPLATPHLDLDGDDSSGSTDNDYNTTFFVGAGAVAVADDDVVITHTTRLTLTQAEVTLTGWQPGDFLTVTGALPAGIVIDPTSTPLQLLLTGEAFLADYEAALKLVKFNNLNPAPDLTPRTVSARVKDDLVNSPTAITTIYVRDDVLPALAIHKTAEEVNEAPLLVGDRILYTIRVTNTTTGTLTNLIITDTLPAGVSFVQVPKGPSRPFTRDGQQVVWERASLAAGDSLTLQVIGEATGEPTPIVDNCAVATSTESPTPITACANLDDPSVQEALTLLKDAVDLNGAPLLVNDVIRYTIYVTNTHATITMTNVVVTDTLPAGTVFVSATQTYTKAAGTVWWQVGDLAPGASWTATVDQRVDGSVNPIAGNVAAVRSDQQDWQDTGDVYPPDPVIQTALKLSKTAEEYRNDPPLYEGDRILYTIRVTNTSTTGALTNLIITDTLPAGVSFVQVPKGPSRPFTLTGQQVLWERASLAADATLTLQVIGEVDGSANPIGENQVAATCAEETTPITASAQVAGDGVHEPGLVVSGTVGAGSGLLAVKPLAAQADQWVYAVTVTNTNTANTMHTVIVSATVPSGAVLVSATPAGYTGVTTLTWAIGDLSPGAVWQSSLTVTQTGAMGDMFLAASSDEQSPVESAIAPPGGVTYRIYLPLVVRQ